ncbi:Uncharacterised protein [Dermatophilus congolensis]|uniref:Uncharacterized protein n=1 Tax=Dermatophilus congolensis TaxID=1863 RepID=A0AA46BLD5_9MICO|nr:Uncharacterised protein [Dermatophilus congolensis]
MGVVEGVEGVFEVFGEGDCAGEFVGGVGADAVGDADGEAEFEEFVAVVEGAD